MRIYIKLKLYFVKVCIEIIQIDIIIEVDIYFNSKYLFVIF